MRNVLLDSPWGTLAVALTVGCVMLVATLVALAPARSAWLRGRLEPYGGETGSDAKASEGLQLKPELERLLGRSETAFARTTLSERLAALIERAGAHVTPARLALTAAGAAIAAFAVVGLFAPLGLAVVAGVVGLVVPVVLVWRRGTLRMQRLEAQLPDVLMTMSGSLKAGLTFDHAMQAIVDEGAAPASEEFARVLRDVRLGQPVEDALEALAVRSGSTDLGYVLAALTIQRELGGSLADLFQLVSDTVRSRQQFRRKVRALTATGRWSAWILIALPFACAGVITVINPGYLAPLFTTPTGLTLVVGALVLMALGSLVLRRVVSIEG